MRRFLSHALIGVAVFILTATFFMWTVDDRVLEPSVLSGELRKAGVSQELSNLMPQIVTADKESSEAEKQDMTIKISQAVTADYVDQKVTQISESVLMFVKKGEPQPVIDISDFPSRLATVGVDVDGEFADKFNEPIQLNKENQLDFVNKSYEIFSLAKYAGIGLFALIMLLEWWVTARGQKLKRLSRVFLYAGLSYLIYWGLLLLAPGRVTSVLEKSVQANYDTSGLIDAVLKAVQGLFAGYFLSFAITSLGIAVVLYVVRHYKHGDVLPASASSAKATQKRTK